MFLKNVGILSEIYLEFFKRGLPNGYYNGAWDPGSSIIIYELRIPESGFLMRYTFKKYNNKWYLFKYEYSNV